MRVSFDKAAPLHQRALEIRKKAFGEEHPAVTQSLDNLAAMHRAGPVNPSKLKTTLKQSLAIWRKTMGVRPCGDSPGLSYPGHILCFYRPIRRSSGKSAGTRGKIIEKNLGPADQHLAIIFDSLSMVYEKMGSNMEAKECAARAYKIRNPSKMQKQKPQNN